VEGRSRAEEKASSSRKNGSTIIPGPETKTRPEEGCFGGQENAIDPLAKAHPPKIVPLEAGVEDAAPDLVPNALANERRDSVEFGFREIIRPGEKPPRLGGEEVDRVLWLIDITARFLCPGGRSFFILDFFCPDWSRYPGRRM